MTEFWHFLVLTLEIFVLIAFLMVLFQIIVDLFSDKQASGWSKALWIILLIVFPILGALIYLIARGRGMNERRLAAAQEAQAATQEYIRNSARQGSATELAAAKQLLDSGTINQEEFDRIKAQVVGA